MLRSHQPHRFTPGPLNSASQQLISNVPCQLRTILSPFGDKWISHHYITISPLLTYLGLLHQQKPPASLGLDPCQVPHRCQLDDKQVSHHEICISTWASFTATKAPILLGFDPLPSTSLAPAWAKKSAIIQSGHSILIYSYRLLHLHENKPCSPVLGRHTLGSTQVKEKHFNRVSSSHIRHAVSYRYIHSSTGPNLHLQKHPAFQALWLILAKYLSGVNLGVK